MNEERFLVAIGVLVPYPKEEVKKGCGMTWDTKIRPRDKV